MANAKVGIPALHHGMPIGVMDFNAQSASFSIIPYFHGAEQETRP